MISRSEKTADAIGALLIVLVLPVVLLFIGEVFESEARLDGECVASPPAQSGFISKPRQRVGAQSSDETLLIPGGISGRGDTRRGDSLCIQLRDAHLFRRGS